MKRLTAVQKEELDYKIECSKLEPYFCYEKSCSYVEFRRMAREWCTRQMFCALAKKYVMKRVKDHIKEDIKDKAC